MSKDQENDIKVDKLAENSTTWRVDMKKNQNIWKKFLCSVRATKQSSEKI